MVFPFFLRRGLRGGCAVGIIMQNVFVVHYHEIALKGRNRPLFLRALQENICRTAGLKRSEVQVAAGRIIVHFPSPPSQSSSIKGEEDQNNPSPIQGEGRVRVALSQVFGIASFAPALLVKADYTQIENATKTLILSSMRVFVQLRTFAIRATRGDKQFALTSKELEIKLGDFVRKEFGKKVDLENPDVIFYVEVFPRGAVVYTEKIPGPGGLPVGTQPRVAVLLSGGIDSPVAAYRMMKRGAPLMAVHFHSYPFTSRASIDKVKELVAVLGQYHGGREIPLYLVPLAEAQKAVVQHCSERYRVLLYRRFMVRIAEALARRQGAQALITGESLGQVASQTVENMAVVEAVSNLPIFRPLIGHDKEEIITEAKRIGTYDISIQPHDDCCSLFMPKNVATRARLNEVVDEEKKIDFSALLDNALRQLEINNTKIL